MPREPYLETCCRSALHRLVLAHPVPRPSGLPDEGCLRRLSGMGLAETGRAGFVVTRSGLDRHRTEILQLDPA